jgi:hypothetical protein
MINWPDLILPPINLWSMPRQDVSRDVYLNLEFVPAAVERLYKSNKQDVIERG